jgi:lactate permease
LRALVLACEVGLILFGAISFLEYMNAIGTTDRIKQALGRFSSGSAQVEALLLAWLFCGFLEGAAGFGAPAALIAPLLATLGFPPMLAAVLPLVGDSAAVPFGAVGTPVRIGLAGLPAATAGIYGAGTNLVAGLVAPLAITLLAQGISGSKKGSIPLALWAGLCFTVPAFAVSFVGPEFPSLVGSLGGLLLFCGTLLLRRQQDQGSPWGAILQLVRAFFPYLTVCAFLLAGKLLLGTVKYDLVFLGVEQKLSAFQPGLVFVIVMGLGAAWRRDRSFSEMRGFMATAAGRLPFVWLAIFCLAGLAQLVVQNSQGASAASWTENPQAGLLLIIVAPVAGALGSFVAGSATVASLLTGPFLAETAQLTGVNTGLVLGLQLVGAGAGNMISLQNIAAVQATVGLVDQERDMLALLWKPCAVYVFLTAVLGLSAHLLGA